MATKNFGFFNNKGSYLNMEVFKEYNFLESIQTDNLPVDFTFSIKGFCYSFYDTM